MTVSHYNRAIKKLNKQMVNLFFRMNSAPVDELVNSYVKLMNKVNNLQIPN